VASELQRDTWQNWTLDCPELKSHQQLWLDPWRTKTDEAFRLERDKDDWQARWQRFCPVAERASEQGIA
jgi:CRISPR-associated protein Csy1